MTETGQEYEERKIAVAAALRELERSVGDLTRALAHTEATIAVQGTDDPKEALRLVTDAYAAMDFVGEREDEPPEAVLGVVGVPFHVVERARAVNVAKEQFETACETLWERRMSATVKDARGRPLIKKLPWVRLMLRELGRPRLSMIAAYRRIPILEEAPLKVAYLNARTRSVYRRNRADLVEELSESSRPGAAEDLARLRRLPPSERYLGEVRKYRKHVRANVTLPFKRKAGEQKSGKKEPTTMRKQIGAALPMLYERAGRTSGPVITFPGAAGPARNAQTPLKKRLQAERYLTTLAVHRYADPDHARYKR